MSCMAEESTTAIKEAGELDPDDEFGQVEAALVPAPVSVEDPYIEDSGYDEANDLVDPETRGESEVTGEPGASGEVLVSEGGINPEVQS